MNDQTSGPGAGPAQTNADVLGPAIDALLTKWQGELDAALPGRSIASMIVVSASAGLTNSPPASAASFTVRETPAVAHEMAVITAEAAHAAMDAGVLIASNFGSQEGAAFFMALVRHYEAALRDMRLAEMQQQHQEKAPGLVLPSKRLVVPG